MEWLMERSFRPLFWRAAIHCRFGSAPWTKAAMNRRFGSAPWAKAAMNRRFGSAPWTKAAMNRRTPKNLYAPAHCLAL
jgi:hypothetical protein